MASEADYTSRDFDSLRADLIKVVQERVPEWTPDSSSDFTVALIDAFSYLGDNISFYIDRAMYESQIATATQKNTLLNFADLVGYEVSGPQPAYMALTVTNNTAGSIDLPVGTQVRAPIYTGDFTNAYFETTSAITGLAAGASTQVVAIEGETKSGGLDSNSYLVPLKIGDAPQYAYEEYKLPHNGVINDSLRVYVGEGDSLVEWKKVSNLYEYGPYSEVYTTRLDEDGYIHVAFGDDESGSVPTGIVSAIYKVGVGAAGNIIASTTPIDPYPTYIPGTSQSALQTYGVTVTNNADAFGGTDGDTLASLRLNIKNVLAVRNQAVTVKDYAKLALNLYGVGRSYVSSAVASAVTVYIQPYNDNSATPGVTVASYTTSITGSSGATTITVGSATNLAVGQAVNGTGIGTGATVTNISGTTVTLSVANSGAVSGTGTFSSTTPTSSWYTLRDGVYSLLSSRSPLNTTVQVFPPTYVDTYLSLSLTVDSRYKNRDVQIEVAKMLLDTYIGLFSYNSYGFGEDVLQSDIIVRARSVPGVLNATISRLNRTGDVSAVGDVPINAGEIAILKSDNLSISASGGITVS